MFRVRHGYLKKAYTLAVEYQAKSDMTWEESLACAGVLRGTRIFQYLSTTPANDILVVEDSVMFTETKHN